ncbi:sulfur carrier protein ThiS [uncultured Abyssibacter sp.]|uniref:sulfur carrier protein ThiS n=1 Tax=uncultured Abyssibacter sp. TaxID=2320202 RepID=UPI0032B18FF2
MEIRLNGHAFDAPEPCTLQDLVERLGLAGKRLAIEVNGDIVTRSAHATHQVQPGDAIEIVHAIGGG